LEPIRRYPGGSEPAPSARERFDRRWVEEQRDLIQAALWEGEERLRALLNGFMVGPLTSRIFGAGT
jgi:hypothetical protein